MSASLYLSTDRLLLREFEEADLAAVHVYGSDPEVARWMPWGPNSEEDTRNFIRSAVASSQVEPRRSFEVAVALKAEERLIGGCGIRILSPDGRQGDIGYCLNRDYWGRGYATEAAAALLAFGFDELGLHRIAAVCDPENVASARVLEKIGMRREGYLREDRWQKGEWRDSLLYAILEHEWRAANAS